MKDNFVLIRRLKRKISHKKYEHFFVFTCSFDELWIPTTITAASSATSNNICLSATTKTYKFFRKLFKFQQMDFEFAMWQCINLFIAPQKVYRNFNYRKHTKSQFARDDPAFLVLLLACMFDLLYYIER
uniref:Uncharacterized protein n=1 Tax=Megaselia scalaris TaxID=36166 RepID=T1GYR9_MEGSC